MIIFVYFLLDVDYMKIKTDYEKIQEFNVITRYLHSHRCNKTLEVLINFSYLVKNNLT
jgi:hypothetical protein